MTPDERLAIIFSGVKQEIVVCGHTHMQFERRVNDIRIVNAGSVGMPYVDRPGAYWLLLGPEGYEFRCTDYDSVEAAREIEASGKPQAEVFARENVLTVPSAAEAAQFFEQIAAQRWTTDV